jgi:hypothetical protein
VAAKEQVDERAGLVRRRSCWVNLKGMEQAATPPRVEGGVKQNDERVLLVCRYCCRRAGAGTGGGIVSG